MPITKILNQNKRKKTSTQKMKNPTKRKDGLEPSWGKSTPPKKTTNPNRPPIKTPLYANLPNRDKTGATENFEKSAVLWENIVYHDHVPVNFEKEKHLL